jgi:hypothetical protein
MKPIINITLYTVIFLIFGLTVFAQSPNDCSPPDVFDYDDEHTLTVDAKTLLEKTKCYDGKFVRTISFYSYGFEMFSLFCPDCGNNRIAWVNTENHYTAIKRCTSPVNFKKLNSNNGATLGVVVLGIFKT